ncbi:CGNR zinc finger domain-containing protein [Micromonospora sp. CA-263727]|uniref:CGNR zinc finger domain-containing protein n=1 Tax=Micromonospora sp. CA-263727 TaxID=3239967 RepID=UPI003D8DE670
MAEQNFTDGDDRAGRRLPRTRFPDPVDNARGWRFICRSDCLCLDFAATRTGVGRRDTERLTSPHLLQEWCQRVDLATVPPPFGAADLDAARVLREAVHAVALAVVHDHRPVRSDVDTINRFALSPLVPPVLDAEARTARRPPLGTAQEVFSMIARDAVDLFGGPLRARIRDCEHEDCTVLFVDTSRSGNRRWCAMSPCGNKINARRYRARQRIFGVPD